MSSTLADLEIATFAVDEVVEGTQTGRDAHTLVVAPSQLAVGAGEPALAEATVEVVRPGDPVRIANVLDVVLPDVRVDDPSATFPGVIGRAGAAPSGRVHRLRGVAVLAVCDWAAAGYEGADELPDTVVDMAGPGADRSPWGATFDVVVRCVPEPDAPVEEADAAVRRMTLGVARAIAARSTGSEPDELASMGAVPPPVAGDLPSVALILQVASEGPLVDTFLRGAHLRSFAPHVLDPRELFGGALTNGAYDWAAVRNVTADYQDPALVRELRAGHRDRLRFAGVVLTPGYLDGADQKRQAAEGAAVQARELGADAVICTTFSSGNSHTDTMLTVRACEARNMRAVALVAETNGGLTDHVPEADCLVSTGNEDELVAAWSPDRVVGGWERARVGTPIPTVHYLGACAQMGGARWTAVPA